MSTKCNFFTIDAEKFDEFFGLISTRMQRILLESLSQTTSNYSENNRILVNLFLLLFEKAAPEIREDQKFVDILEEMKRRNDNKFTAELIECRLFGHRFSLRGEHFESLPTGLTSKIGGAIALSLERSKGGQH